MNGYLSRPRRDRELRTAEAFTLTELLVVVAIIAVLVAIAVPVGIGMRKKASQVNDAANLRDIASAVQLYVSDKRVLPGRVNRGIAIPRTVAEGDREKWLSTFLEDAGIRRARFTDVGKPR